MTENPRPIKKVSKQTLKLIVKELDKNKIADTII